MRRLQIKNWQKYSFEFLSIFIAVISAFALNNWNENRKDRYAENKILTEIYKGLEKDLEDISLNVSGHKIGVAASNYFRDLLANKPVDQDSLMLYYAKLTRDFVSIQNTSGYEALKSRGLELVEDDSLRTQIIELYEYNYSILRKLEEEYFEMQFQENYFKIINHTLAPNFQLDEYKQIVGIKIPLDIAQDKERELLVYLWRIEENRSFALNYYTKVEEKIKHVRSMIKARLGL